MKYPPGSPVLRARRGAISIFTAISLLVLIGLVGLALDTAWVLTTRLQLQRTADAAALAGASKLLVTGQSNWDAVRNAVRDISLQNPAAGRSVDVELNTANVAGGDVVLGRWQYNTSTLAFGFTPNTTNPNAVMVVPRFVTGQINNPLALFFGSLFNVPTADVGQPAIAQLGRPDEPLILVLDPHASGSFLMNGNGLFDVFAGTVQVDSDDLAALRMNGTSGLIQAQRIRVVGESNTDPGNNIQAELIEHSPYVPDPLASLPEPTPADPDPAASGEPPLLNLGGISSAGSYGHGYYPNGINVNSGFVDLGPGTYIIGKNPPAKGVDLGGSAVIRGTGVFIYLETGAKLTTSGSGAGLQITPPSSGTYEGVSVFQARANSKVCSIQGNGVFDMQGTFYLPNGELSMGGDVTRRIGRIIVNTLNMSGNGSFTITGLGLPPSSQPFSVFLVQ